jgi:hypothetical protein
LNDVAKDISKDFYLTISQTKEDMGQRLSEFIGVESSDVPAVKIVVP